MSEQKVGIIGAGLAGLCAAYYLQKAGVLVTVFEKNSFIGGRLGSISNVDDEEDIGAQYFTLRSPLMLDLLPQWQEMGLVKAWSPRIHVIHDSHSIEKDHRSVERWVGTPSMVALANYFAPSTDIRCDHEVQSIALTKSGEWQLKVRHHGSLTGFSALLFSLPAPLIGSLLQGVQPHWQQSLEGINFLPTLGARVSFSREPDLDAAFINHGMARWLANNSSKPGRRQGLRWTLHLDHQWSAQHAHLSTSEAIELIQRNWQLEHLPGTLESVSPFFWPQAIALNPPLDFAPWDSELKLGALGDWHLGGRVEGALLSGYELSRAVIKSCR
ncbi:putative thiazole biosynthetic enzyme [Ferrovum sp. JA12]|uniref:NAD(P)/FAD-dependent oxidoreductase n=1 Tax=Ferrovum sp. JA12 TaxID=1356299 RepID=UPI0007033CF5|nr:FAD-dependent oxidoreductase [Ferrovum sp. JA12]KRH78307.1 putative thiazole biosynthetic enzyme [Ferrovum sp. JA12]